MKSKFQIKEDIIMHNSRKFFFNTFYEILKTYDLSVDFLNTDLDEKNTIMKIFYLHNLLKLLTLL
jgi:hypothetical protein